MKKTCETIAAFLLLSILLFIFSFLSPPFLFLTFLHVPDSFVLCLIFPSLFLSAFVFLSFSLPFFSFLLLCVFPPSLPPFFCLSVTFFFHLFCFLNTLSHSEFIRLSFPLSFIVSSVLFFLSFVLLC